MASPTAVGERVIEQAILLVSGELKRQKWLPASARDSHFCRFAGAGPGPGQGPVEAAGAGAFTDKADDRVQQTREARPDDRVGTGLSRC